MLYNKDWNKPARDIQSLDSLIHWLGQQKATKRYSYHNGYTCLLAQYYTDMGLTNARVGYKRLISDQVHGSLPDGFNVIAKGNIFTRLYGLALRRAIKLKRDREWHAECWHQA